MDATTLTISSLLLLYIGFKLGIFYENYKMHKLVEKLLEDDTLNSEIDRLAHQMNQREKGVLYAEGRTLKLEIINNNYYFYFEDDDSFACQGTDLEQAAKNFCMKWGNKFAGITVVDKQRYAFYDDSLIQVDEA